MFLVIIFLSPVYFLVRKRWFGFVLNAILYILAWMTIMFFGIGVLFWALGVGHAFWVYREDEMRRQADLIGAAVAKSRAEG